jgi:hypothetical protein
MTMCDLTVSFTVALKKHFYSFVFKEGETIQESIDRSLLSTWKATGGGIRSHDMVVQMNDIP